MDVEYLGQIRGRDMVCGTDGELSAGLQKLLEGLSAEHRQLIYRLLKGADNSDGLGPVDLFLAINHDARLLSLLELAMRIHSDDLDQLLFAAEDYYSQALVGRNP